MLSKPVTLHISSRKAVVLSFLVVFTLLVGFFILVQVFVVPKAQANPDCEVDDGLKIINGNDLTVSGNTVLGDDTTIDELTINGKFVYTRDQNTNGSVGVNGSVSLTSMCDVGDYVTGGGCRCVENEQQGEVYMRISEPTAARDGWVCTCTRHSGSGIITNMAYAICY